MSNLRLRNTAFQSLGRITVLSFFFLGMWLFAHTAYSQSLTSGDIAGTVTDPSGANVANASVYVKSLDTGQAQTVATNGAGTYRVSLLKPGKYSLTVTAPGFETASVNVDVSAGIVVPADIKLTIGSGTQTIEVSETEPLLHTDSADISTTFTMQQVQSLPNPGNDLTFVAQTAPGVVMNTTTPSNGTSFGYGNFSVFGLPATSNTFTVNGGYENDPFLNLNNSGATNLLLGNNDVAQVSVVNNPYSAQYGGLAGSQVNEITRSGTNSFHGNANYWWNGRIMNANDYFRNQTKDITPRTFDNVNQWAAGVGGPIIKDRLFFFVNTEGLRVVIPVTGTAGAPSQAFENAVLSPTPICPMPTDPKAPVPACANPNLPNGNLAYNGNSAQVPYYQQLFSVWNGAKNYASAVPSAGDPNAVVFPYSVTNFTHEWLLTARVDYRLSDKDTLFGHFEADHGLQATYTDPLNPIFNADSIQPQYQGQLNETHIFSPKIANQFVFADIYYSAIFTNQNLKQANALVPGTMIFLSGSAFNSLGGDDLVWPQGRNVNGYQLIDDLSINHGKHTVKFGWSIRRDNVTDYSPQVYTSPEQLFVEPDFAAGNTSLYFQQFPTRLTQPVSLYNMGWYAQDEWKIKPNLQLTFALRMEHNSNPVCHTSCFATLNGPFESLSTDTSTPYNSMIKTGQYAAFPDFAKIGWQPRFGFTWSPAGPDTKTVVRGGFGMFSDVFPATIADSILNNSPTNNGFTLYGPGFGGSNILTDPSQAGSAAQTAAASNVAFLGAYPNGGSFKSLSASVPGFAAPSFTTPLSKIYYPTYEEWSLGIDRQLDKATALTVMYVGDRGYHEPVQNNGVNSFQAAGPTVIAGYPQAPANNSYSTVTEVGNGASSNYNGLIASVVRRSKMLTLQANYTYSHAMDEISNGGILGFSAGKSLIYPINPFNLRYNYGNSDYDSRHNITAGYVFTMPYYRGPRALTDGWELSGTVFHHTGFPFTVADGNMLLGNGGVNIGGTSQFPAAQINGIQSCGGSHVFNNATGGGNACAITQASGNYTNPTGFGQQGRNQVFGPAYTDTDLAVVKGFAVPHWESAKLKVGAQFFNLFNHPNFANPTADIANTTFNGLITSTVNTPTSILGSGLGGDASPRLIQLKATFSF
ncbi:carboxypeptidase regulatory-like domain-containing protein [Alloacidobacterium dinghuense]|uniref:Carboxypeptidase regulatory-like domain-containing protein n=1 Tax=Alloacidobacterium dinghuense TaxID=2763107 RepID=A0A7G8BCH1_9BACT|nr:carboxypeptidase regulatory-like domain-containing protein [Alloacidobacterium dinghuense]QNI30241.1 carboxypeptidase regulatory-like domain-containing protein [Alloacidobacterium dinghuense]